MKPCKKNRSINLDIISIKGYDKIRGDNFAIVVKFFLMQT